MNEIRKKYYDMIQKSFNGKLIEIVINEHHTIYAEFIPTGTLRYVNTPNPESTPYDMWEVHWDNNYMMTNVYREVRSKSWAVRTMLDWAEKYDKWINTYGE